jgi:hypothetical protein
MIVMFSKILFNRIRFSEKRRNMITKGLSILIIMAFLIASCNPLSTSTLPPVKEEIESVNTPALSTETVSTPDAEYLILKTTMGDFIIVSGRLVDEVRGSKAPPGDKYLLVGFARPGMEKLVMGEFPLEDFRNLIQDGRDEIYVLRDDGSQLFFSGMGGWLTEDDFVMGSRYSNLYRKHTHYIGPITPPIPLNIED